MSETDNLNAFESDDELRRVYGDGAVFSRVGVFTLVHLDNPTPETVVRRTTEFDPNEFFVDDCPLCQASRDGGGHFVFAGTVYEDDEESPSYIATRRSSLLPYKEAILKTEAATSQD